MSTLSHIKHGDALKALYGAEPVRDLLSVHADTNIKAADVTAIDPGPTHSAIATIVDGNICTNKWDNVTLRNHLRDVARHGLWRGALAIEQVRSYGMPVGAEVFDTVQWTGQFMEASGAPDAVILVPRLEVKMHLCHNSRANDSTIRQAILDRFGGKSAIGTKKAPGKLYKISGDMWAALAVALVVADRLRASTI